MLSSQKLICIAGPTASGKTSIGVALADKLQGEILSADSRQVYRGMDIGTGKDLKEYTLSNGKTIPYHLINITEAGQTFDLYHWKEAFDKALEDIYKRTRTPILVGGSGLYIETALGGKSITEAPPNLKLRKELEELSHSDLLEILRRFKAAPQADTSSIRRCIRAIEIASYYAQNPEKQTTLKKVNNSPIPHLLFCLTLPSELRWEKIENRLYERLKEGMIEEVEHLLKQGIAPSTLIQYGLEYKFITLYLQNTLSKDEMIQQLIIAIRQFSKRQMTWFRGMKKRGFAPQFIDATLPKDDLVDTISSQIELG